MLKNYKDLKVWEKAYRLCLELYKLTKEFPAEERYTLTTQIRRAALSVPSNIAEGYGRRTTPEYVRFLYVAYGSVCELETQILIAGDLGFFGRRDNQQLTLKLREVERMLKALINSLEKKSLAP